MQSETLDDRVGAVRQFNRFYTREIGVLREGLLHTAFSLTEARILFELAAPSGLALHSDLTATGLCRSLGLDAGYLSRILARLEGQGLIVKTPSEKDARQRLLRLTPEGEQAFALLDRRSREEVSEMLSDLSASDQQRLLKAMRTIEDVLERRGKTFKFSEPFYLRAPEPGDLGWVVHRHGALYAEEYHWDETFEALVAQVVADFVNHFNPAREHCWIAEMDGEIVGSVFVVQLSETVAKLRLLLVEPTARGLGLGNRLIQECICFARKCGYQKMTLWTNSVLLEARHLYKKNGFQKIEEEEYHGFGQALVSETWELIL